MLDSFNNVNRRILLKIFKTNIKINGRKQTAPGSDNVRSYNLYNICKSTSCYSSCKDVVNKATGLFVELGVDLYIDLIRIWGLHLAQKARIDLLSQ